jgi:hypothetical protein
MDSKLTKLAAAAWPRVSLSHIDTTSAQLALLHSKVEFREGGEQRG